MTTDPLPASIAWALEHRDAARRLLDKLDADQLVDAYADMLGVDPSLIVADKQVAMIRQDRAKAAQAQQVAAMAPAMKDMAQAGQAASQIDPTVLAGLFQGYSIPGVA